MIYFFVKFFYFSRNDIKYLILNNLHIFFFKSIFLKLIFSNFNFFNKIFLNFNLFLIPIYYENSYFLLLNKPFNILIYDNTFFNDSILNNFLFFYGKKIFFVFRLGILNRLDKDTTGLMFFFKKLFFYIDYLNQFHNNFLNKYYIIYIMGIINLGNYKFSTFFNLKKIFYNKSFFKFYSFTKFFSFKNFKFFNYFISLLKINLFSGRTHQIRIHFNYIKRYIICDKIYNNFIKKYFFYLKRHSIHLYSLNIFFNNLNLFFFSNIYYDMFFFYKFLKFF